MKKLLSLASLSPDRWDMQHWVNEGILLKVVVAVLELIKGLKDFEDAIQNDEVTDAF